MRLAGAIVVAHLVAVLASCTRAAEAPVAPKLNILLSTIDTLRADRVRSDLTPTLESIAARGLRFSNARSTVPLTLPAHASIMTGQLPPGHGARLNGVPVPKVPPTVLAPDQRRQRPQPQLPDRRRRPPSSRRATRRATASARCCRWMTSRGSGAQMARSIAWASRHR